MIVLYWETALVQAVYTIGSCFCCTFGKVFRKGLHVVCSVLSGGIGTQVSSHRLHLLLQSQLGMLLGSLVEVSRK